MREIRVGDRVRSYDFPDFADDPKDESERGKQRAGCYVEGPVVGIEKREGFDRYVIEVDRDVWRCQDVSATSTRIGTTVYPPVNGTPSLFGGATHGVELLEGNDGENL